MVKNVIIGALITASVTSAVISVIPTAKATDNLLSTEAALNSPVLNSNFVTDDWNKWEMAVWGIYLSNFCKPLIDTYETAFTSGKGGSDGAGYAALCFGSGSDAENNKVIQALCTDAIKYQQTSSKQVYVAYTYITGSDGTSMGSGTFNTLNMEKYEDPNTNPDSVRPAELRDFFFQSDKDETAGSSINTSSASNMTAEKGTTYAYTSGFVYEKNLYIKGNMNGILLEKAAIPTFFVKTTNGQYKKIFDFTDSWDLQTMTSMLNALGNSDDTANAFSSKLDSLWTSNTSKITFDSFGNILVDGLMFIPASANQHLTTTPKINMINSFIMNNYTSTYSDEQLVLGARAAYEESWIYTPTFLNYNTSGDFSLFRRAGVPALGDSNFGNVGFIYYDLDEIAIYNSAKGTSNTYGDNVLELMDCDINNENTKYAPRFEVSGTAKIEKTVWGDMFRKNTALLYTKFIANTVTNQLLATEPDTYNSYTKNRLNYILNKDGSEVKLYSSTPVLIANQLDASTLAKEVSDAGTIRMFYNYVYKSYKGNTSLDSNYVKNCFKGKTFSDVSSAVDGDMLKAFKRDNIKYKDAKNISSIRTTITNMFTGSSSTINDHSSRLILAYPVSDVMKQVSSILGVVDGTEFNVYSTLIYMTYLDWYNVSTSKIGVGTEPTSDLDTELFDKASDILQDAILDDVAENKPSKEDMKDEVLTLGYLILSPEDGRDYRKNMIYSGIEDFIYEQYNRIVFGGKSSTYTGTASRSNSGFLAVETYSNNFLVAPFLKAYSSIILWLIVGLYIAIILIGLLKKKKLGWFLLNCCVTVNVLLLVPSSGEIVPYVTNRIVNSMFRDNMTYWSLSEGVTNSNIENDAANNKLKNSNLSDEEAELIASLVKQLSTVYNDRSLMLKQDISQKVMQNLSGKYSEIQSYQSARWLLPMIMQQFSGDDSTSDYLYIKLGNVWDDMSNIYWYYNPSDAQFVTKATATSGQADAALFLDDDSGMDPYSLVSSKFSDHKDFDGYTSSSGVKTENITYRSFSYSLHPNNGDLMHKYYYYMGNADDSSKTIPSRFNTFEYNGAKYKNRESWRNYIKDAVASASGNKGAWLTNIPEGLETNSTTYDRTKRSSLNSDIGYLKTTENPIYYFYSVIKDSNESDKDLGYLVYMIEGTVGKDSNDEQVRQSFMHANVTDNLSDEAAGYETLPGTGYVRDILDLEEMFSNLIPYMYQVQLLTGGSNGSNGILGDATIQNSPYYEGTPQSWMYRCNWAAKIMENPELSAPETVFDADGNKYKVTNPLLPECYPENRPMIFSEAQMKAYNLRKQDLSNVELRCVETNSEVCDKWTLLLNYIGTSDLTKEVIYRQMATDAATIFNTQFSTAGIIDNTYKLYPQSIDLRYLSFDSVMKLLMLNATQNTNFVYGDTMQTVISDSSLITAITLWLDAFICASIIPIVRMIVLALIFYLGFIAIFRSMLQSNKYKSKVACAQFVNNIMFLVYTIAYYGCIYVLVAISSRENVISVSNIATTGTGYEFILLVVLVISGVYILLMCKQVVFLVRNYKDMGLEVMSMFTGRLTDKIDSFIHKQSSSQAPDEKATSGKKKGKKKGDKDSDNSDSDSSSSESTTTNESKPEEKNKESKNKDQKNFTTGEKDQDQGKTTSDDINKEIDKGKKTELDEKQTDKNKG